MRWHTLPAVLVVLATGALASAADGISPRTFAETHQLIKPQQDESLWLAVPWLTDVWEARQRAAAEGKPILLWSGGGAAPIGGC